MKRIYKITTELDTETQEEAESKIKMLFIGKRILDIENVKDKSERTNPQNASLHKFCTLQSDELQNKGIPMYTVLTFRPETIWTMEAVKQIWRDIQFVEFGTKSTTALKKVGQIETIVKIITKLIAESTKGHASTPLWPSNEFYRNNQGE